MDKTASILNRFLYMSESIYIAFSSFISYGFSYIIFPLMLLGIFIFYKKIKKQYLCQIISGLVFLIGYAFLIPFLFGESLQLRYVLPFIMIFFPIGVETFLYLKQELFILDSDKFDIRNSAFILIMYRVKQRVCWFCFE